MIRQLEEKDIEYIASTHLLAWQKAFQGILSDKLLHQLNKEEFVQTWHQTIKNKGRTNYVALTSENVPVGFVSFDTDDNDSSEIYGIYVNPNYWGQGYGKSLMGKAIAEINSLNKYSKIVLWVMTKNNSSRQFYEKIGFRLDFDTRISFRLGEEFEECKYTLVTSK